MSLFGSSGIRGVVGSSFTPDLAVKIGNSVGSYYGEIIHGRDPRTSGVMFLHSLVAGETSAGSDSYDAGMIPTPTLAKASEEFSCGVMITASHNPPEYNGVKLWNPDGSAFDTFQMNEIEESISSEWKTKPWDQVGKSHVWEGAVNKHIEGICQSLGSSSANAVVDCGCGATSVVSPLALRTLGCDIVSINAQPDGYFPGRSSEPTEDQLQDLRNVVIRKNADLGIAHDGDGDRMVALDEHGNFISGDRLVILFASWLGVNSIAVPVDASMVVDDLVRNVTRCRVGDVFISEILKKDGIEFGGEPSGTFIFPKEFYCPDGIFAGALLSQIASERNLSEYLAELPSYPVSRSSLYFKAALRNNVSNRLKEEMESLDCERLITIDGYRAEFPDGWFIIRLSGTEPKLRVVAESRDEDEMKRLKKVADKIVARCVS